MSPEQARGDSADHRCDIYSLGVVFYELLTGQRPFRGGTTPILDQLQCLEPAPPRQCNAAIPRDLQAICLKALAKDPARRYQRAAHLAEDLRHWLAGEPVRHARRVGRLERAGLWIRRRPLAASMGTIVVMCLTVTAIMFFSVPPGGPTVKVLVSTTPPGADLHYFPIDLKSGLVQPRLVKRGKAGAALPLAPGYYLVVAVLADDRFHEVFRYVPQELDESPSFYPHRNFKAKGDVAHLPRIAIPNTDASAGMCLVPPAETVSMGSTNNPMYPVHRRRVPSFYLDTKEVTVDDFLRVRPKFRFPAEEPVPAGIMPMNRISWDDAAAYAESIGKRLPDETEYEYVATDLGRRQSSRREEIKGWPLAPSGKPESDCVTIEGQPPIFGLCSNVAEWTSSWYSLYPGQAKPGPAFVDPMTRVVRGGPLSVILGMPDNQVDQWRPYERVDRNVGREDPGVGFRCARSAKARLRPEDFIALVP
jgi:serine/threonine-protein kinase